MGLVSSLSNGELGVRPAGQPLLHEQQELGWFRDLKVLIVILNEWSFL